MEITIAQMGTVMQSMADPVILTDTQHRVIMQNKAAERFFRVPDEMTEGLVRAVEFNNLLIGTKCTMVVSRNRTGGEIVERRRDSNWICPRGSNW